MESFQKLKAVLQLHSSSKYALLLPTVVQESLFDELHRHEGLELRNVCRVFQRRIQTRTGPSVIWHSSVSFRGTNRDRRWMASGSPPLRECENASLAELQVSRMLILFHPLTGPYRAPFSSTSSIKCWHGKPLLKIPRVIRLSLMSPWCMRAIINFQDFYLFLKKNSSFILQAGKYTKIDAVIHITSASILICLQARMCSLKHIIFLQ